MAARHSAIYPSQTAGASLTARYSAQGFALHPAASTATTGIIQYVPFIVPDTMSYRRLGIRVAVGQSSTFVRMAVYSDLHGLPEGLMFESASISSASAGNKQETIAVTIPRGRYWFGFQTTASTATFESSDGPLPYIGWANSSNQRPSHFSESQSFGAFPAHPTLVNTDAKIGDVVTVWLATEL